MSLTAIEFFLGPLPQVIALLIVAFWLEVSLRSVGAKSQPVASRLVIIGFCAILVNAVEFLRGPHLQLPNIRQVA